MSRPLQLWCCCSLLDLMSRRKFGKLLSNALRESPEALRVEPLYRCQRWVGGVPIFGRDLFTNLSSSSAFVGLAFSQLEIQPPNSFLIRPRAVQSLQHDSYLIWIIEIFGGKPSSDFVAATSSAPSAEPCDLAVFRALGAGQAITVFNLMRTGLSVI